MIITITKDIVKQSAAEMKAGELTCRSCPIHIAMREHIHGTFNVCPNCLETNNFGVRIPLSTDAKAFIQSYDMGNDVELPVSFEVFGE